MRDLSLYPEKSRQEQFEDAFALLQHTEFTRRETDLLACLIEKKPPKKIASLLEIAPKTVSVHLYNVMEKINLHSRKQVIELLELSHLAPYLKKHYVVLEVEGELNETLKEIAKMHQQHLTCVMDCDIQDGTAQKLLKNLKTAGILAEHQNKTKLTDPDVRITLDQDHNFVILQNGHHTLVKSNNLLSSFDVLAAILPSQSIRQFVDNLKDDWRDVWEIDCQANLNALKKSRI